MVELISLETGLRGGAPTLRRLSDWIAEKPFVESRLEDFEVLSLFGSAPFALLATLDFPLLREVSMDSTTGLGFGIDAMSMISWTWSLKCWTEVGAMAVGRVTVEVIRYEMVPCSNYRSARQFHLVPTALQ